MRPIATSTTSTLFTGDRERGVEDLPIEESIELAPNGEIVNVLRSRWRLTDEERAAVMLGADLVLDVFGKALPPVRPTITAPPVSDPPKVFAILEAATRGATLISTAGLLGLVGIRTDASVLSAWSELEIEDTAEWLKETEGKDLGSAPACVQALVVDLEHPEGTVLP